MSRLQFLEVGSLILRVLSVKVSILEVGSWILRVARCSVCVCVGSFFGGGVMDLEGCQVSRLQFLEVGSLILRVLSVKVSILEVGSWILRAAGCQGLIFWRWGHGS